MKLPKLTAVIEKEGKAEFVFVSRPRDLTWIPVIRNLRKLIRGERLNVYRKMGEDFSSNPYSSSQAA